MCRHDSHSRSPLAHLPYLLADPLVCEPLREILLIVLVALALVAALRHHALTLLLDLVGIILLLLVNRLVACDAGGLLEPVLYGGLVVVLVVCSVHLLQLLPAISALLFPRHPPNQRRGRIKMAPASRLTSSSNDAPLIDFQGSPLGIGGGADPECLDALGFLELDAAEE